MVFVKINLRVNRNSFHNSRIGLKISQTKSIFYINDTNLSLDPDPAIKLFFGPDATKGLRRQFQIGGNHLQRKFLKYLRFGFKEMIMFLLRR